MSGAGKIWIIIFSVLLLFYGCKKPSVPQTCLDVEIYSDAGVWQEGVDRIQMLLRRQNLKFGRINADRIKNYGFNECTRAFILPGGNEDDYWKALREAGMERIRNFISSGGGYLGICAGAYAGASRGVWEGRSYPGMLRLFPGTAIAPIPEIAPWPKNARTTIRIVPNPVFSKSGTLRILYWGGPYFEGKGFGVIAVYTVINKPAVIYGGYGAGRWVLTGPHPEYDEASHGLFYSVMDWLLRSK